MHEYLDLLHENARPVRNANQRVFDMIIEKGSQKYKRFGDEVKAYHFFMDLQPDGTPSENSLFGIDEHLENIVNHFDAAAHKLGKEKRVLLLHGPVASAKSTIATLLKRGLENNSHVDPIYTFRWLGLGNYDDKNSGFTVDAPGVGVVKLYDHECELHEDPLKLVDVSRRPDLVRSINDANRNNEKVKYPIDIIGQLCPHCRFNYDMLMAHYGGDWDKVMNHIKVFRFFISEGDRRGIGTFQPKDEKNQDAADLTGSMDFRRIAILGSDSDPRAFNFNGELCVANRGIIEFIEILKLERAFLYDLLVASQEQKIKPKKFALTDVDLVILGHTNEEEFRKLLEDELMKAFKDRTSRYDVPYNLVLDQEEKIYGKIFTPGKVRKHIAPHTFQLASIFAELTRLEAPKEANDDGLGKVQKMWLYNGRKFPDKDDNYVRKLIREAKREGLDGISTRFIIDAIGDASVKNRDESCLNPFQVYAQIEMLLDKSAILNSEETIKEYKALLKLSQGQYLEIIKDEVNRAVVNNPEELRSLFTKYLDNLQAYIEKKKLRDPFQPHRMIDPDEKLMRSIEEKIEITEAMKDNFRSGIVSFISRCALGKEQLNYDTNETLYRGLVLKLFEEKKDLINFSALFKEVRTKEEMEKIDLIKANLKKEFGYCDVCAGRVLEAASSIFARGDARNR
ncbi:MAG: serine protein kinase [Nanoarchaeota archaeon]